MKRQFILLLAALLVILGGCQPVEPPPQEASSSSLSEAQTAPPSEPDKPAEPIEPALPETMPEGYSQLLNDRLWLKLPPDGEYLEVQDGGIMAAKESNESVTRIRWKPEDGKQCVMQASELGRKTGGSLLEDATMLMSPEQAEQYTPWRTVQGDRVVVTVPKQDVPLQDGSYHLFSALALSRDDGVIAIMAYMLTDTPEEVAEQREIMLTAIDTLLPGSREQELSAHEIQLETVGITVAEQYMTTMDYGVDFVVCYLNEVVAMGQPASAMGIYMGRHPSVQGDAYGRTPIMRKDTVLGKEVEWAEYRGEDSPMLIETLVPMDVYYIHLFLQPVDEESLEVQMDMVRSMKFSS